MGLYTTSVIDDVADYQTSPTITSHEKKVNQGLKSTLNIGLGSSYRLGMSCCGWTASWPCRVTAGGRREESYLKLP